MKNLFLIIICTYSLILHSQDLFNVDTVKTYYLNFYDSDWDAILDSFIANDIEDKILATLVVDGIAYDSVGVKYKGNSSYNEFQVKNPMHIELDYVKKHNLYGYENLKLSNMFKDPSCMREVLSYEMLRNYMPASKSNYAMVYVNGIMHGLFVSTQSVNKDFVEDHFGSKDNSFFKCDPISVTGIPAPPPPGCPPVIGIASPLVYMGPDTACYKQSYDIQSDSGAHWIQLVNLISVLENDPVNIDQILDVDRALWMLAFNNIFVNLDSYTGSGHNYYLYENDYGKFNTIIWDLNENLGCFTSLGGQPPVNLTFQEMTELDPLYGYNNPDRPLLKVLLSDLGNRKKYIAHYKTILEELVYNDSLKNRAAQLQTFIDPFVQLDPNKLYSYNDFLSNLDNNIGQLPGINTIMDARSSFLQSNVSLQSGAPSINNVIQSNLNPEHLDTVWITAEVGNAIKVWFNYKTKTFTPFVKKEMFDDGLHGDGNAGDGVYGVSMLPMSPNVEVYYYIYAENNEAGKFLPERAEYEFFQYKVQGIPIAQGQLVVNEFMALNGNYFPDSYGEYDDWMELYNNSPSEIKLNGIGLSDDVQEKDKWIFPDTSIAGNSYLVIWCDGNPAQGDLHANFKLSASGEEIYLTNSDGTVVDEVSFSNQAVDMSYGRYPNGIGSFRYLTPTIGNENWPLTINSYRKDDFIKVFPNPASENLNIVVSDSKVCSQIELYNILMQPVLSVPIATNQTKINVREFSKGVYIMRINNWSTRVVVN